MDRVFVNRADPCDIADEWSVSLKHRELRAVLARAAARAAQTGQATLASLVLPAPDVDPLRILCAFQQLYPGTCFYWEQPAWQRSLVGTGAALSLEMDDTGRFEEAAQAWQKLRDKAVIAYDPVLAEDQASCGPLLFGGFSFDPLHSRTALWQDFPHGLLILPALLFNRCEGQQATLTLSRLVQVTDNLDNLTDSMSAQVIEFSALLAKVPVFSAYRPAESREAYAVRDVWPAEEWKDLVGRTARAIQQGEYAKVVLAREVQVAADGRPFSLTSTLQHLRQNYPGANVFALQRGSGAFIGATPERLIHARDGQLHTMALAGSAPRGADAEEDRLLGSALLRSSKNREEHEIVVSMIHDALAHLCSRVWAADTPELLRLKNIQHLQTAIVGELLPGRSILEALQVLHPTPAVGGSPTESALAFIRTHENLDRGWYAGPIGWVDLQGNGEFAVALRSALLEAHQATLFAGCGIMADSDPEAEYAESCLKLQVILRSLSGEE